MKTRSITCILTAISMTAVHAATTSIFDDSFSGFNNGNLNNQFNWGSQAAFSVNNGNVIVTSSSGVFARAQRFGGFRPEVGDQVRITVSDFAITGSLGIGNEDFRFGIASSPENTGAQTPQVYASVAHNASSLTIGGATDTGYNLGDQLSVVLTLTRQSSNSWSLESQINNVTDGTSVTGSATPGNENGNAGASAGLTLSQYLEADSNNKATFGMRLVGGNTGAQYNIGGVKLETIAVPEPSTSISLISALTLLILRRGRRTT